MSVGPFGPGGSVIALAPGASMSVEAAFSAYAPAGGSVIAFAPGASMSTEAAFAAYAPAGGSLGLNANGSSLGVEAAFANALQSGFFAGSSLGVEAAFSSAAPVVGGSMNLPGFLGFEGSSIGVEAAFLDHGPRNPTGVSCMTGAGASMAVEGAFSEVAPPAQLGGFVAAADAPVGRGFLAAPEAPIGRGFLAAPDASIANGMAEESSTPRPLAGVSSVFPHRQIPLPVPQRTRCAAPVASHSLPDHPWAQPALSAVTRHRQGGNASFRAAPPVFQYSAPVPRQMDGAGNDIITSRSLQPPLATEVRPYPYMYPTPDFRQEAIPRDGPALTERISPQPFDRYAHSYTGVISSVPRDTPSYVPRVTPSATPQGLSLQQMPAQGLSLQQMPIAPGVSYPGPVPQRNISPFATVPSPFVAQQPHSLTIESTPAMFFSAAATSPAAISAPSMSRQPQRGTIPSGLQTVGVMNGHTARYPPSMQPSVPTQLRSAMTQGSVLPNMASTPFQIPTSAYIRPTQIPSQVPSFTAPVVPSAQAPQVPSFTAPQLQHSWAGQMPVQYSRPVVAVPI